MKQAAQGGEGMVVGQGNEGGKRDSTFGPKPRSGWFLIYFPFFYFKTISNSFLKHFESF